MDRALYKYVLSYTHAEYIFVSVVIGMVANWSHSHETINFHISCLELQNLTFLNFTFSLSISHISNFKFI